MLNFSQIIVINLSQIIEYKIIFFYFTPVSHNFSAHITRNAMIQALLFSSFIQCTATETHGIFIFESCLKFTKHFHLNTKDTHKSKNY